MFFLGKAPQLWLPRIYNPTARSIKLENQLLLLLEELLLLLLVE